MTREERIIAYVDGELAPAERARFEADMAADAALTAEVTRHKALAQRVSAAYAPVLEEPIPPQLLTVASAANDHAGRRAMGVPQWAAMAACLALGVIAGRIAWPASQTDLAQHAGTLVAQGRLDAALTRQLAAEPGVVKVGLSFRAADGRYCRTFQSAPDRLAGLACRGDGRWIVRTVTASAPTAEAAYRTAGDETPPEVLAAVDQALAGEPLDAKAERAARDHGWR